jgi:hypothetical protein
MRPIGPIRPIGPMARKAKRFLARRRRWLRGCEVVMDLMRRQPRSAIAAQWLAAQDN